MTNTSPNVSVEQFVAMRQPGTTRRGVLGKWRDDILALDDRGYSTPQINEFLRLNGVSVNSRAVWGLLKRAGRRAKKA